MTVQDEKEVLVGAVVPASEENDRREDAVGRRTSLLIEPIVAELPQLTGETSQQRSSNKASRRLNVTAEAAPFDISYHPGRVLLYSPPRQRQKWGDAQVLPRVNWGDLFFDLFYVAATYNVSYILVDSPSKEGLLYAAGTFLPIMSVWTTKVFYDSRYVTEDDIFHRCVNVYLLVLLAVAVLHIRPVKVLSDAAGEISMFVFSLVLVLERLLVVVAMLEVHFFGVGQKARKPASLRDIRGQCASLPFYVAALTVSAIEYFGSGVGGRRLAAAEEDAYESSGNESSYSAKETTDVPIWLCLAGFIATMASLIVQVIICFPSGGKHKDITVPINVDFAIHRNGEWTMLMLGESIFSLLIIDVPNEGSDFFATFYCGILTVVLLQYLHFRSQPQHADLHALRRDKNAGVWWNIFLHAYSLALVCLGAAYTFFLLFSGEEEEEKDSHRRLTAERWLAEAPDLDEAREPAAHLFSGSLAVIFFCLDVMTILHLGIKEGKDRCRCARTKKWNAKGIAVVFVRGCLVVFTATLSQWETEPESLAIIGLFCVLAQLLLRKLGILYLEKHVHPLIIGDAAPSDAIWPNVTHARAAVSEEH